MFQQFQNLIDIYYCAELVTKIYQHSFSKPKKAHCLQQLIYSNRGKRAGHLAVDGDAWKQIHKLTAITIFKASVY